MGSDDPVHLDKALRVPSGLELPHAPLPFARWLMRILGPVVQIPMLPVSHAGHHHSLRDGVAAEFVRYDDSRAPTAVGPQQLAKEADRGESVSLWLHENIDHNAVLIHRTPEIMPLAVDL